MNITVPNENIGGQEYRDLIICNGCLWSASLLKGSRGFIICPVCRRTELELTPVGDFESYLLKIDKRRGLDIEFSDDRGIK